MMQEEVVHAPAEVPSDELHGPMQAAVSGTAHAHAAPMRLAIGDTVVIVWPSHRAHGHNARVTRIYDDGKYATETDAGTWCLPACRLERQA